MYEGQTVCESRNTLMLSENMPPDGDFSEKCNDKRDGEKIPKDHGWFRLLPQNTASDNLSVGALEITVDCTNRSP